jgi:uncharacterized protein
MPAQYAAHITICAGAPIAGSAVPALPCIKAYVGIGYTFGWLASWLFGRHYTAVLQSHVPKLFIMVRAAP